MCNWGWTEEQSSALQIQALYSADVILPGSSSKLRLLVINLASVPGGQLVNSPTAQSPKTLAVIVGYPNSTEIFLDILTPLKKLLPINLCNKLIAHIFTTELLHNRLFRKMRRDVFQALADPTRRAILLLLASHAMTPNAIAEEFHTSRQAVSKHIQMLTECELVKQEQQGREIYYSLEIKKMKEIDKWLEQFKKIWENRFDQLDNVLSTLKKNKK